MAKTMKNIKNVLINYVQKQRFQFQDVFSPPQVKSELISTLQEIQMFLKQGMNMVEINYVINKQHDDQITNQGTNVNFDQIINYIKKYKVSKNLNGYKLAMKLINETFKGE